MSEEQNGSHRDHAPTIDEQAGHCFGCGPANPEGLHLVFWFDAEAQTATALVNLTRNHEGPRGHIHGGIIATLMDEAMSKLNRPLGVIAMTRHMEVDYLRNSCYTVGVSPIYRPSMSVGKTMYYQVYI